MKVPMKKFLPITPAGTPLIDLEARSEEAAWRNLERQLTPGMYADRDALVERGYTVGQFVLQLPHD